jgi:hypothetical protein
VSTGKYELPIFWRSIVSFFRAKQSRRILKIRIFNNTAVRVSNQVLNVRILTSITIFLRRVPQQMYGRTAALRLIVQPCDEDEEKDD